MCLEVVVTSKWKKSYDFTALQLAHDWKNSFKTLENAVGCKVFIIDLRDSETPVDHIKLSSDTKAYRAKKGILFRPNQLN